MNEDQRRIAELEDLLNKERLSTQFYKGCEATSSANVLKMQSELKERDGRIKKLQTTLDVKVANEAKLLEVTDGLRKEIDVLTSTLSTTQKEASQKVNVAEFKAKDAAREMEKTTEECKNLQIVVDTYAKHFTASSNGAAGAGAVGDSLHNVSPSKFASISSARRMPTTQTSVSPARYTATASSSHQSPDAVELALLNGKVAVLTKQVESLEKELSSSRFLLDEEKSDGARFKTLYYVYSQMVKNINVDPVLRIKKANVQPARGVATTALPSAASGTSDIREVQVSDIEALIKENGDLQKAHGASLAQIKQLHLRIDELVDTNTKQKEELQSLNERQKTADSLIGLLRAEDETHRAVECDIGKLKAAFVALLSVYYPPPHRTHEIQTIINEELRDVLDVGAAAVSDGTDCGATTVTATERDRHESLMLSALTDRITDLAQGRGQQQLVPSSAQQTSGPLSHLQLLAKVPQCYRHLPLDQFASIVKSCEFASEVQAYTLALGYLSSSPCYIHNEVNVSAVLDEVRFLWLPVSFLEFEIDRIRSGAPWDPFSTFATSPRRQHPSHSLLLSHTIRYVATPLVQDCLLIRLEQALRFKAILLPHANVAAAATFAEAAGEFEVSRQHSNMLLATVALSESWLEEARRIRLSYAFLPVSLRHLLLHGREGKDADEERSSVKKATDLTMTLERGVDTPTNLSQVLPPSSGPSPLSVSEIVQLQALCI